MNALSLANKEKLIGNELYSAGRYAEALVHFDNAIEICSDQAPYHLNKGMCLLQLDRLEEALTTLTEAIRCDGRYAKAFLRRAEAYIRLNRLREAKSDLAIIEGLENEGAANVAAKFLVALDAYVAREDELNEHWDTQQPKDRWRLSRIEKAVAAAFYAEHSVGLAIEHYSKAIDLVPYDPILYHNRSVCWGFLNSALWQRQGLIDALKATELDPNYTKAWLRAAYFAKELRDYKKALKYFKKANELASTEETRGQIEQLMQTIEDALQARRKKEFSYDRLKMPPISDLWNGLGDAKLVDKLAQPEYRNLIAQVAENPHKVKELMGSDSKLIELMHMFKDLPVDHVMERYREVVQPQHTAETMEE